MILKPCPSGLSKPLPSPSKLGVIGLISLQFQQHILSFFLSRLHHQLHCSNPDQANSPVSILHFPRITAQPADSIEVVYRVRPSFTPRPSIALLASPSACSAFSTSARTSFAFSSE